MLGVGPDQQDGVHDGDEELGNLGQLETGVVQLIEVLLEGLEILVVLVGLKASDLNLFLELAEGASLGGLVLLEELEDFLDALSGELFTDGVQVFLLVLPELDFGGGTGVHCLFEGGLGVLAQLSLDLLGPVADCGLQNGGLVLGRGLLGLGHVGRRQGQAGSTLNEAKGDLGEGKELVEVVDQVLPDEVRPADLVLGVAEHGEENFLN